MIKSGAKVYYQLRPYPDENKTSRPITLEQTVSRNIILLTRLWYTTHSTAKIENVVDYSNFLSDHRRSLPSDSGPDRTLANSSISTTCQKSPCMSSLLSRSKCAHCSEQLTDAPNPPAHDLLAGGFCSKGSVTGKNEAGRSRQKGLGCGLKIVLPSGKARAAERKSEQKRLMSTETAEVLDGSRSYTLAAEVETKLIAQASAVTTGPLANVYSKPWRDACAGNLSRVTGTCDRLPGRQCATQLCGACSGESKMAIGCVCFGTHCSKEHSGFGLEFGSYLVDPATTGNGELGFDSGEGA
ncbi:hypothetical protein FF38_03789 [Lucilia cuprina]|uniref:Uncharacterized protein n=1 Tax=Lucilia cuprina TaxID=7375 RepID=A0A0L0C116_LUCCU|nr:hypothetical protein FF38_03789 [Lucilia cuprina]